MEDKSSIQAKARFMRNLASLMMLIGNEKKKTKNNNEEDTPKQS